jgi:hypothetical protein
MGLFLVAFALQGLKCLQVESAKSQKVESSYICKRYDGCKPFFRARFGWMDFKEVLVKLISSDKNTYFDSK